jgi:hypothetical protein
MLASALTGIWLWLPSVGRILRGFRWNRGPSLSGNLHYQVGIWVAIPLAILTGAYISFPAFFRGLEQQFASAPPAKKGGPDPAAMRRMRPAAETALDPDLALALVRQQVGEAPILSLRWPMERTPEWTASVTVAGKAMDVTVHDATRAVAQQPARSGGVARFMRQLHDGNGYNPLWQTIIFVAGIAPLLLGITGVIMWLRTRGWRRRAAMRRATA